MAELESTEEMQKALEESSIVDSTIGIRTKNKTVQERYEHLRIDTTLGGEEADILREATYAEIDHYSITPTTFQSRTFFGNTEPLSAEEQESHVGLSSRAVEKVGVSERLSVAGRITSAINQVQTEIRSKMSQMQDDITSQKSFHSFEKEHANFQKSVVELRNYTVELQSFFVFTSSNRDLILTFKDMYKNGNGNEVIRFGINVAGMNIAQVGQLIEIYTPITAKVGSLKSGQSGSNSKKSKQGEESQSKMLHPLEALLIQDATAYLEREGAKTVLVDIFARDGDNSIRQKDNTPEIHSVVLYKTAEGIIVIDPTDSKYSKHLEYGYSRLKFFRDSDEEVAFITFPKGKIYIPDVKNTGPNPDQLRDCIDIATKLALELNKFETDITAADIMSSSAVKIVTNSSDIMMDYIFQSKEAAVRIKQASDDEIRQKVNKLLLTFNSQIQLVHTLTSQDVPVTPTQVIENFEQRFKGLLKSPSTPEEYKNTLKRLLEINKEISAALEITVIGHIEEVTEEDSYVS